MNNMPFEIPGVKPGSDVEKIFCAIGVIIVQWGHCEQCLDLMVASIYPCLSKDYAPKRRPKMLETKLEKLEKWFKDIFWLSPLSSQAFPIFDKFKTIKNMRHDLIHGAIDSLDLQNDVLSFIKIDIIKNKHQVRRVTLTDYDFQLLIRDLLHLGKEVGQLSGQTQDIVQKHQQQHQQSHLLLRDALHH